MFFFRLNIEKSTLSDYHAASRQSDDLQVAGLFHMLFGHRFKVHPLVLVATNR